LGYLPKKILPAEPGQTFVPDGTKKLLDIWVRHELFLFVFDRKLEPFECLAISGRPSRVVVVVIQYHHQFF
jgi:hypothetical protein